MKETIIKLRKQTGAGMSDIKEALEESKGDEEKALEILRKKGQKIVSKRATREAGEGLGLDLIYMQMEKLEH